MVLSNHLILCHPILLCLQSFPASGSFPVNWLFASGRQTVGASTSASASVLPMNISGLFSFMVDWFDILAVQGNLKSLLQDQCSKASILPSVVNLLYVQLSHPYMTTAKKHSFD